MVSLNDAQMECLAGGSKLYYVNQGEMVHNFADPRPYVPLIFQKKQEYPARKFCFGWRNQIEGLVAAIPHKGSLESDLAVLDDCSVAALLAEIDCCFAPVQQPITRSSKHFTRIGLHTEPSELAEDLFLTGWGQLF
ncbi:predicted protein [Coccidioides posadasii str. Silveira]|uniref:Predicted protein n=1 Tax=Coccidioides posadasii (strain RMSCC 757 / Silveira) TaxID=443226 RepID=E9D4Z9_COCPS|nr:predicted protein [Coccidioides posadasii str. Silveira]